MEELALKAILKYHVSRCVLLTRALINNDIFPERVYFTYHHGLSKGNVKTLPTREGRVEFLELRPGYITAPTFIHCTNCTTTSSIRYEISIPITKNGFQFFLSSDNSGQYLTRWSAFGLLEDLNRGSLNTISPISLFLNSELRHACSTLIQHALISRKERVRAGFPFAKLG